MQIFIGGIEIELLRKKIKNMHLYVLRPDGNVRLSVPEKLSDKKIESFILSRLDWIQRQREKINSEPHSEPLKYTTGEKITIFGKEYFLEIVHSNKNSFDFFGERTILYCKASSTSEQREAIVKKALRQMLYERIAPIFKKWESITELHPSSYQIKSMKTRWGTCNTQTKKIWLNLELAHKNEEYIEYVIMHELAHLKVSNHGKDFIAVMDYYMPRWRELREKLNK